MFQDITVDEWAVLRSNKELVLIDVRSPSEYRAATVPGSLNIPLFDDQERAEIGTLYKQVSVQAAKERGLEIVSAKLPSFIKQFSEINHKKAVFCWRGGMRSKTTATLLSLMGIHAYRLSGGYRAYRQWAVEQLQTIRFAPPAFVLHGHTGSGKTAILQGLKQKGHPILDIEGMAGHRGSIFGEIGLQAHNQKTFDSLLLNELHANSSAPYVIFEAENRKVGKVTLPEVLMDKRASGYHILIELPLEARVRQIIEDYRPWEHPEECMNAFKRIRARIHTPVAADIEFFLKNEQYDTAVELLLIHYYDPRYSHSSGLHQEIISSEVRASSVQEALLAVEQIVGTVSGQSA
ncbi:tRNA 2-selenouridine(34) synthase MnmH [Paenibacillus sp. N4]|uniref:tRNA 2-selenouridine(34) synthase MnmH n=1 Tax=Paenibacillus vietnamensis TaxID=2590547 RepID=UPI001CD0655D|nr:tRNA 2-selenouridine(34) synthase MnmH [Paenibacillus vietnamensis]MCA0753782.1 tRNA 2-selenouridine(34) synthase MnmH [Paenibacillus vietnamensis]